MKSLALNEVRSNSEMANITQSTRVEFVMLHRMLISHNNKRKHDNANMKYCQFKTVSSCIAMFTFVVMAN